MWNRRITPHTHPDALVRLRARKAAGWRPSTTSGVPLPPRRPLDGEAATPLRRTIKVLLIALAVYAIGMATAPKPDYASQARSTPAYQAHLEMLRSRDICDGIRVSC